VVEPTIVSARPSRRAAEPDGSAPAALVGSATTEELAAGLAGATRLLEASLVRAADPFTGTCSRDLRQAVDTVDLDRPLEDLDAALQEASALYLRDAVWFHHPRYMAHLNCPVTVPAVVADVIATAVNTSMDTWDQSAGATHIERGLVRWTADRLGLGPAADGIFTTGGTGSNLQALLLARARVAGGRHHGPEALPGLRVLASAESHFSVQKAAFVLGLGYDAVVPVTTDHE
jgi:L-2,4-diaminobutyrate decarboxylase